MARYLPATGAGHRLHVALARSSLVSAAAHKSKLALQTRQRNKNLLIRFIDCPSNWAQHIHCSSSREWQVKLLDPIPTPLELDLWKVTIHSPPRRRWPSALRNGLSRGSSRMPATRAPTQKNRSRYWQLPSVSSSSQIPFWRSAGPAGSRGIVRCLQ